jgi:hypothetical protein
MEPLFVHKHLQKHEDEFKAQACRARDEISPSAIAYVNAREQVHLCYSCIQIFFLFSAIRISAFVVFLYKDIGFVML